MKHTKLSIAIASAVTLWAAPFVAAVPTLWIDFGDDGIIEASAVDQTGSDTAPIAGLVIQTFTDFSNLSNPFIVSATGSTKPVLGSATRPELAETTLQIMGQGKIAIYFSEDLYGPTGQSYVAELSVTSLAGNATVDSYSYATLAPFTIASGFSGAGTPMTSLTLNALGASTGGGVLPFDGSTNQFTLIQKVIINQPNGGSTQMTANLKVPDGGTTLALLGGTLLGLGSIRRKMLKA